MQNLLHSQPGPTPKTPSRRQTLTRHFFRRFFDNDTLSLNGGAEAGETQSAILRALAFCAIPGLMFAFWLLPSYPNRPLWNTAADRYFFPLFSFVAMGLVATFELEMLFPDRADFLILLPLGLKSRDLFYAKARALITFLALFLAATNIFSAIFFPAVSTGSHGSYFHTVAANLSAVLAAGLFAAFTMLAIQGLTLILLPAAWFRTVSTAVQCLAVTALLLLFLLYPLIAGHLQLIFETRPQFANFLPPLWFLALYQSQMPDPRQTAAAAETAHHLAQIGLYATAAAIALAALTYPLAWSRQKTRALEGTPKSRRQSAPKLAALLHQNLLKTPQKRGIFHFLTQTITRNPKYQIYLATYAGAGLALALCSTLTLSPTLTLTLSSTGLHALLPLLLFWLILGLKSVFAFPTDMAARWVFPISLRYRDIFPGPPAKTAKLYTQLACTALTAAILALLLALHWPWLNLAIQLLTGTSLCILLPSLFFQGRTQIPFTRPRMPGRQSLPLVFTLYAALYPALILITVKLELAAERDPTLILWTIAITALLYAFLTFTDRLAQKGIIGGFPEDETDQGPQTLGLTQ